VTYERPDVGPPAADSRHRAVLLNPTTFDLLRKMKPMRQIEAADLMSTAGNYTASYAKALLAATRQADLVKSEQPKKVGGRTPDQRDLKMVAARYGDDVLHLVIASGRNVPQLDPADVSLQSIGIWGIRCCLSLAL
jgi:hypothetical protein